jgi:histidinol-phosphatase (PHP family)
MIGNFHTHTTFCDGKNTPEEIVLAAIEKGFSAIGFSGHGYTEFDLRYCMKDTAGYVREIRRLQEKYKNKIQVYLGIEEDAFHPADRSQFDYIIGSSHYFHIDNAYLPIDSNYDYFCKTLDAFSHDLNKFAEWYFTAFCQYLQSRKPDLIGHFDLVTKFDETQVNRFLCDEKYWKMAEKFTLKALQCGSIFEVNTGLMARNYRFSPCPHERLLSIIAKNGGRVALSSDAHEKDKLCAYFDETRALLRDIGFDCVYALYDGEWKKDRL